MIRARLSLMVALALFTSGRARAADPPAVLYAIVIGHNDVPRRGADDQRLTKLRYADDDAAVFFSFMRDLGGHAFLLTVFDADTERRFPELVAVARPPTRTALEQTVESVRAAIEADAAAGRGANLVFFYSGHGVRTVGGAAALALLDGPLDQETLYDGVLARLPVQLAHVIVDACHAEALVRPRDADARIEPLAAEDERGYLRQWTLARFPHVGALLASTSSEQTFEWDGYHGGIFAHELLSALRGGADIDGDGRIEYSEVAAFLAAANYRISDEHVRPHVVVQAPRTDRRAAIADLGSLRNHFSITGRTRGPWAAPFFVESEAGTRILDLHPERNAAIAIRLPAGQPLTVVRQDGEARITGAPGAQVPLSQLKFNPPHAAARGSAELAIERGLFASTFGTGFYEGYTSQQSDLVPVGLAATGPAADGQLEAGALPALEAGTPTRRLVGGALMAGAAASTAGALIAGALTLRARSQYQATNFEHAATDARQRFEHYSLTAAIAGALAAGLSLLGFMLWSGNDSTPAVRAEPAVD